MNSSGIADFVNKVDQVLFGCLVTSTDILLQGRRANFFPKRNARCSNVVAYSSNSDFCNQALLNWKNDLSTPLYIDISILITPSKKVLIERWNFSYERRDDVKDGRLSSIKKRIVTFLRSLYSFLRLLPGFQILKYALSTPNLLYELNHIEDPPIHPSQLNTDSWKHYEFPPVFVGKGHLVITINYVDSTILQKLLNINLSFLGFSPTTSRDDSVRNKKPSSAGPGQGNYSNPSSSSSTTTTTAPIPIQAYHSAVLSGQERRPSQHSIHSISSSPNISTLYYPTGVSPHDYRIAYTPPTAATSGSISNKSRTNINYENTSNSYENRYFQRPMTSQSYQESISRSKLAMMNSSNTATATVTATTMMKGYNNTYTTTNISTTPISARSRSGSIGEYNNNNNDNNNSSTPPHGGYYPHNIPIKMTQSSQQQQQQQAIMTAPMSHQYSTHSQGLPQQSQLQPQTYAKSLDSHYTSMMPQYSQGNTVHQLTSQIGYETSRRINPMDPLCMSGKYDLQLQPPSAHIHVGYAMPTILSRDTSTAHTTHTTEMIISDTDSKSEHTRTTVRAEYNYQHFGFIAMSSPYHSPTTSITTLDTYMKNKTLQFTRERQEDDIIIDPVVVKNMPHSDEIKSLQILLQKLFKTNYLTDHQISINSPYFQVVFTNAEWLYEFNPHIIFSSSPYFKSLQSIHIKINSSFGTTTPLISTNNNKEIHNKNINETVPLPLPNTKTRTRDNIVEVDIMINESSHSIHEYISYLNNNKEVMKACMLVIINHSDISLNMSNNDSTMSQYGFIYGDHMIYHAMSPFNDPVTIQQYMDFIHYNITTPTYIQQLINPIPNTIISNKTSNKSAVTEENVTTLTSTNHLHVHHIDSQVTQPLISYTPYNDTINIRTSNKSLKSRRSSISHTSVRDRDDEDDDNGDEYHIGNTADSQYYDNDPAFMFEPDEIETTHITTTTTNNNTTNLLYTNNSSNNSNNNSNNSYNYTNNQSEAAISENVRGFHDVTSVHSMSSHLIPIDSNTNTTSNYIDTQHSTVEVELHVSHMMQDLVTKVIQHDSNNTPIDLKNDQATLTLQSLTTTVSSDVSLPPSLHNVPNFAIDHITQDLNLLSSAIKSMSPKEALQDLIIKVKQLPIFR